MNNLSPSAAPASMQRPQPFRCSPLFQRQLALGATMTERYGWRTAAHFTAADEALRVRAAVGLADASWLGKLDVRGTQTDDVASGLERAFTEGPPGAAGLATVLPRQMWRLAHQHALVTCGPDERGALVERVAAPAATPSSAAGACLHLTDVTSVYAALLLAGPRSRDVLHKLTSVDVEPAALPNRTAAQGGLAHVHAIVLRADLGTADQILGYWLLVARNYGEYLWDAVMHAGHDLGLVPFGVIALDELAGRP
jgi:heterotetrameric sarcosine oxidase gamma subunit